MRSICNLRYIHPHRRKDTQWLTVAGKHPHRRKDASRLTDDGINNKQHVPWKLSYPLTLRKVCFFDFCISRRLSVNANAETKHLFYCFPLGNRLWRFPRSRSKPALCPPYVFFTLFLRKRKTPKQNICETNRLISWPLGQVVKTSPFHGGNTGSIPVGVIWSQISPERVADL